MRKVRGLHDFLHRRRGASAELDLADSCISETTLVTSRWCLAVSTFHSELELFETINLISRTAFTNTVNFVELSQGLASGLNIFFLDSADRYKHIHRNEAANMDSAQQDMVAQFCAVTGANPSSVS